jgi:hypothetical protein
MSIAELKELVYIAVAIVGLAGIIVACIDKHTPG